MNYRNGTRPQGNQSRFDAIIFTILIILLIITLSGCSKEYLITQVHKEGERMIRYDLKDIENTREYYIRYYEAYYDKGDTLHLRKNQVSLRPLYKKKVFKVEAF
jgi:hypothetical protein